MGRLWCLKGYGGTIHVIDVTNKRSVVAEASIRATGRALSIDASVVRGLTFSMLRLYYLKTFRVMAAQWAEFSVWQRNRPLRRPL